MKKYILTENQTDKKTLLVPEGRHEVSYDQWNEAYKYLELSNKAKEAFEEGNYTEASLKGLESIARLISSLSSGVSYEELIKLPPIKLNNIFLLDFGWLANEKPKKKFTIKGRKFNVPNFSNASAGDFMDVMSMIMTIEKSKNEMDFGLMVAAVYMREGEYKQDEAAILERVEFLKKYAKMDVLYSAGFFLTNFLVNLRLPIEQHLSKEAQKELLKLTSSLSAWVTSLYSQALQKAEY